MPVFVHSLSFYQRIVIALGLMVVATMAFGQSFTLTADTQKAIEKSAFNVKFTLDGAKGVGFTPPDFSPFEVLSGPSTQTSMSIINGAVSQSMAYEYTLFAPKKGKFEIPAASIRANGRTLKSNSLQIEVVEGEAMNAIADDERESYVEMTASTKNAILGQQITLEYKLYTQQDVNGIDLVNEPDYDGFFSQELGNYRASVTREIIGGKEYYTKVVKKIALFPQRTGTFTFDPVIVNLAIPIPGAKRRGFFSSAPTRRKQVMTNELVLMVTNPPEPAPISFSGAVGKYAMSPKINRTQLTTDDAVIITMELRGTGDGKTFSAPEQPLVENLEYYDPNVIRDEDTSRDGVVSNYKQIEYLIVPKKAGNYVIRPEFTYFDTDSNDYVTLAPRSFRIKVAKGTRSITRDDRDVSISQTLLPDRSSIDTTSKFMLTFFDPFWWTCFGLGILGFVFIGFRKYQQDMLDNLSPEEKKRRKALQLAERQLETAKSYLDNGDGRKFFEEISLTMNRYLGNKYGMKNTDFHQDKIVATLEANAVDRPKIDSYISILKSCEMALFAGQPTSKMNEIYTQSRDLILKLEE